MSLTDYTYFVRDINIPNPTAATSGLTAAIARYEPEILEFLLGYPLAKLVLAYANPGSEQRIIDLVEGKEYTYGSFTVNWNGLKNAEKVSILSYHVYIQYLKDKSLSFQNVGVIEASVENGVNVGPGQLVQRASMELHELAGYPGQSIYAPSLYNFLRANEADYPELIWRTYQPINMFGI